MIIKEIKLMRNILLKRPLVCLWQVTARCNFTCEICRIWHGNHSAEEELSLEQINAVTNKLKRFRPMLITLAGGEPLLRNDLPDIVKIVSRNHYCSIITNGWHMTRELPKALYRNGMSDAMVSIDYATPELHDAQRGKEDAFKNAIAAIEFLRDARPNKKHRVRILAVLLDNNINEIEGLLLIAKELSVSFVITLYSDGLGKKEDRLPKEKVSDYLLELKKRHKHFDSAAQYLASFDRAIQGGIAHCGGGSTFININQQGMISRCVDRYDIPVANPLTESTNDIFKALKNERMNDPCSRCWTSCRGIADIVTGIQGIRSYPDFLRSSSPYDS